VRFDLGRSGPFGRQKFLEENRLQALVTFEQDTSVSTSPPLAWLSPLDSCGMFPSPGNSSFKTSPWSHLPGKLTRERLWGQPQPHSHSLSQVPSGYAVFPFSTTHSRLLGFHQLLHWAHPQRVSALMPLPSWGCRCCTCPFPLDKKYK
jgi:hypothetical protein